MTDFTPVQTSPYSLSYKLKSRFWTFINKTIFRWSPFFMRRFRVGLIRCFGANVAWTCSLDSSATIVDPWNLTMGAYSSLGEGSCIRCRDKVTIGEKTCIARNVDVLTASHNISSSSFELISSPVFIGNNVWLATGSTVMKGVTVGEGAVVAACSLVLKNVEPWTIVGGNPAKFIKKRVIKE